MKISYIVPGSGDTFYCENCLRDMELIKALQNLGHKVTVVPMYLPFFLDNPDVSQDTPVFFGGLNVYLQQHFKLFRNTPRWLDKLLDSTWLLKVLAQQSGSTKADGLGGMTLSMLKGIDGNQFKELERLTNWLKNHEQPDIIHISNALLSGIAGYLKTKLNVPIVCTLQDEDEWLDAMAPPYDRLCWDMIASQSSSVDAYIAVSDYYAGVFRERAGLPGEKVHRVYIGINSDGYIKSDLKTDPPVIGYLARMSPALGLSALVDAFILIKSDRDFKDIRLRIAGGAVGSDISFVKDLKKRLLNKGMLNDVDFVTAFDKKTRIELLQSITLLSVPSPSASAFGTYILEALSAGVPVVQPDTGAFPEIINATNGGLLYKPNTSEALAIAIKSLLNDRPKMLTMSTNGRDAVLKQFNVKNMASGIAKVYQSTI